MKSLAIMQPYFFPYIGYWQLINAVDCFVIYDDVNYKPRGWINRNRLLINGEARYMTAPLQHASQNTRICDIFLESSTNWRDKLIRMIEITYRNALYFSEIFPVLANTIDNRTDNLSEYLTNNLMKIASFLEINTKFIPTSQWYMNNDFKGQDRIIDICKREAATTYINPQGGEDLYDQTAFINSGLNLKFLIPDKN
ncbi:MAG: WbqC family protein [Limnohabitans sp.]